MSKQIEKVSKAKVYGKTDFRYWKNRIFKNTYTRGGAKHELASYSVKIQHRGRRESFNLSYSNKELAAKKAVEIYVLVLSEGFENACEKYKSKNEKIISPTVGEFIRTFEENHSLSRTTLVSYVGKFRRLVSEIMGLNDDSSKFHSGKGSVIYRDKVDQVLLAKITPQKVNAWKQKFLNGCQSEEEKRGRKVTINSIIRNSKSLFSPKALMFVASDIGGNRFITAKNGREGSELKGRLSVPFNPFEGIQFERVGKKKYDSAREGMNAELIFISARNELAEEFPEQYKIFLLAITAGLRRKEIDWLKWKDIDFGEREISVSPSKDYSLKNNESEGRVPIDKNTSDIFLNYRSLSKSEYVISSARSDSLPREVSDYRCSSHYSKLINWLRGKGVTARQPLHTLRKEAISLVARKQGIHVASAFARHSDIRITTDVYAEQRVRAEVDTTALLGGEIHQNKKAS
ncbi:tyrosine-type recombinase/integrase [Opitutales bacterium]|nr:tyrosine-type recombinase/integrase [Opitutales bacterium]